MSNQVPNRVVNPYKLAVAEARLEQQFALADMPRLDDQLLPPLGTVNAELQFERDEQGRYVVSGRLQTQVQLACQRCFEAVSHTVDETFQWALIRTEDDPVPKVYDPVLIEGEALDLVEQIEEEFVIATPSICLSCSAGLCRGIKPGTDRAG